ncbi:MAG: T9SS type A sorting domain-containing protein [Ignavibacteria bacterium]|nr:T9SS type A sorting domain-containing protein [Ignavibacteria bacterium]
MKKLITFLTILFLGQSALFAAWGFFGADQSYIGVKVGGNSVGNYVMWNSGAGNFLAADMGLISDINDKILITYWDIKTWKNNGGDVTSATLYYRIYETGSPSGSFNSVGSSYVTELGNGDQKWGFTGSAELAHSPFVTNKNYTLEVYIAVTGTTPSTTLYDNVSGANYKPTFSSVGALPVELTSFNAAIRNGLVDLKWETATEVNNYGFEVERKSSSSDWNKIGFIEGHGSTNSPKYYSFSDKPTGMGKISYRLKQIDNDGKYEYSPIVEVLVDNLPNGFVLEQNYPNPFNPETSIRFALKEDTKATLKVYNSLGAEVATLFDGTAEAGRYYDVKFGSSELASGFYIYKLVAGDHVSVKKMLLMK